jgi:hypothetical protein
MGNVHLVLSASFTASSLGGPLALIIAGPAFAAVGSRPVLAGAAGAQLAAMLLLGGSTLARCGDAATAPEAGAEMQGSAG